VSGDGVGYPCCLLCGGLLRGGLLRGGLLRGGLLRAGLLRSGLLRVRRLFSGPCPFRPVHSLLLMSMAILSSFCNTVISTISVTSCSYSGPKYYDHDLEIACFFPFFSNGKAPVIVANVMLAGSFAPLTRLLYSIKTYKLTEMK
jgi:hypothetical protein